MFKNIVNNNNCTNILLKFICYIFLVVVSYVMWSSNVNSNCFTCHCYSINNKCYYYALIDDYHIIIFSFDYLSYRFAIGHIT